MKGRYVFITTGVLLGSLVVSAYTFGDAEEGRGFAPADVRPVAHEQYAAECGSCHFAYQPGLLPARSWQQIMSNLDNHFGENAELGADVGQALTQYLVANAAEQGGGWLPRRIMSSVPADQTPERITSVPYIIRKHNELPARMVADNPDVGSLSRCAACHTQAEKGVFNEHTVRIPGHGAWDD